MATESAPNGSLARWIVPVALFVVIVGAIAWVSQNLPQGPIQKTPDTPPPDPKQSGDLRFLLTKAVWDVNDSDYLKSFETGVEGYYDFPFLNPTKFPVTLGCAKTSCDCSLMKVAVIEPAFASSIADLYEKNPTEFPIDPAWKWTTLKVNDKEGVQIPAGGGGVTRLQWDGRKGGGSKVRFFIKMWMQPTGKPDERSFETLDVPFIMADPVNFHPLRLALGAIVVGGQEKAKFIAWSATRKDLELKLNAVKNDPLFEVKLEKLDAAAAKALEAELPDDKNGTRIQAAYRIEATVRTQNDGKLSDLGHFSRDLPLVVTGYPFDVSTPNVTAYIRGEVDVGTSEDGGKINLRNFSAKEGVRKAVPLWSDGGAELVLESVYPRTLEAKLTRNAKESTAVRSRWTLDITVPPGAGYGVFSEDAVIILRSNSTPPRRIRIPIVGNAGQG